MAQPQEERHGLIVPLQRNVNKCRATRAEQFPCFEHRLAVSAIAERDAAARDRPEVRSKQRMDARDSQTAPAHCSNHSPDRSFQAANVQAETFPLPYSDGA